MSIEDKLAIQEALARYAYLFENRDLEALEQLVTDDAVSEIVATGATSPELRIESRAAIRDSLAAVFQRLGVRTKYRFFLTNPLFETLTAESAHTRTMVMVTRQGTNDTSPHLLLTGMYDDQWRKTPGGWQLARRTLRHDHSTPFISW